MMFNIGAALTGTLTRMHRVQRYSSVPVLRPENVAEHSWQIAMISYLIGTDLNQDPKLIRSGQMIRFEILLPRAITHDVSETLSGDIIRSYKHSSTAMREACHDADLINMAKLRDEIGLPTGQALFVDWSNAKASDLEGDIVMLADLLCVVAYCIDERSLGNTRIDTIAQDMYEQSLTTWHGHKWLGRYVDKLYPNKRWDDIYMMEGVYI